MVELRVSTDGYRSADGHAAWAFVVHGGELHEVHAGPVRGAPSHVAEWVATHEALAWLEAHATPGDDIELRTDSALVAKGLAARRPTMSGEAAELRAECRRTLARLGELGIRVRVQRVDRTANAEADAAARQAAGV